MMPSPNMNAARTLLIMSGGGPGEFAGGQKRNPAVHCTRLVGQTSFSSLDLDISRNVHRVQGNMSPHPEVHSEFRKTSGLLRHTDYFVRKIIPPEPRGMLHSNQEGGTENRCE